MNVIQYLVDEIKFAIPEPILRYAFLPNTTLGVMPQSMDWTIRDTVIQKKLLRDLNIIGGTTITVDISRCKETLLDGGLMIEVPRGETAGRDITTVLDVSYGIGGTFTGVSGNEIVDAAMGPPQLAEIRISLIGPNTVYIEGISTARARYLRCIVANESELNNYKLRSLPIIRDLAVLATKAYIYSRCIVDNDSNVIRAGIPYSSIQNIIDGYSDALEIYNDLYRTKGSRVAKFNDPTHKLRFMKIISPR